MPMQPRFAQGNVIAHCPDCDSVTTFEEKDGQYGWGNILKDGVHTFQDREYRQIQYVLLRCAACGRGGLACLHVGGGRPAEVVVEAFYPAAPVRASLPAATPDGVVHEFREAELCASVGAWRAASGLLRSTLEKALRSNGY